MENVGETKGLGEVENRLESSIKPSSENSDVALRVSLRSNGLSFKALSICGLSEEVREKYVDIEFI